jgi:hypothetical protein
MAISRLDKSRWQPFFDQMSKQVSKQQPGKQAAIEVASLAIGAQIDTDWLPLLGITYDPRSDMVEIFLEGCEHMIPKPREIYIDSGALGISCLEVTDSDGAHQIVRLSDPVRLPTS